MNNHDLEIPESTFERQNRRNSLLFTVLFHIALLLPLFLITCSPATEPELTLIEWGGGGDPNVDAPVGQTPKGEVDGGAQQPSKAEPSEQPSSKTTTPETPKTSHAPDRTYQPKKEEKQPKEQETKPATSDNQSSPKTSDNQSENESDAPKGNPEGEGNQPASGSGQSTAAGFGAGSGRHWLVDPRTTVPRTLSGQYGTVVVSYVIKSDGSVQFRKVSVSTSIYNQVIGHLSRSRANAIAPGSPDVRGQGTITLSRP